jgi:hypothetical protein
MPNAHLVEIDEFFVTVVKLPGSLWQGALTTPFSPGSNAPGDGKPDAGKPEACRE